MINPYDGELTFLGRVLGEMPCDIRIGKLLVLGHVFGVLEEAIVIGSFENTCINNEVLYTDECLCILNNIGLNPVICLRMKTFEKNLS